MKRPCGWKNGWVVSLLFAVTTISSQAQTFNLLTAFNGTGGAWPLGSVTQATDGNLYATAEQGGAYSAGIIFKIVPSGEMTTLYNFGAEPNCTDGGYPTAGLVQGTDGNFYGTTYYGGAKSTLCVDSVYFGYGTVFQMTPAGKLTTLYSFCSLSNCADGEYPRAALLPAIDGNFYGTTAFGGANGAGSVFKITPNGTLTTVYSFCSKAQCADGTSPFGGLIQTSDGNFYGTTVWGGANGESYCAASSYYGCGTVFRLTPGGKLATLYSFCSQSNCSDGGGPYAGLIQAADGNLYGTTSGGGNFGPANGACWPGGCGTAFKITPNGRLTALHKFCEELKSPCADGASPVAGLIQATDGNLYGTTSWGGAYSEWDCDGCGTIFNLALDGTLTTLHNFNAADGASPSAALLQNTSGVFFGTSSGEWGIPGSIFSLSVGVQPFVSFVRGIADVGKWVQILGQGFAGTSSVSFNGTPAAFRVKSNTYLAAIVPPGATTGSVTVTTPSGILGSNVPFRVRPQILSFAPTSGPEGTQVTITGMSLTQAEDVAFGGESTNFMVSSDTQVTASVPSGAQTGPIAITTLGGKVWSAGIFTVTK